MKRFNKIARVIATVLDKSRQIKYKTNSNCSLVVKEGNHIIENNTYGHLGETIYLEPTYEEGFELKRLMINGEISSSDSFTLNDNTEIELICCDNMGETTKIYFNNTSESSITTPIQFTTLTDDTLELKVNNTRIGKYSKANDYSISITLPVGECIVEFIGGILEFHRQVINADYTIYLYNLEFGKNYGSLIAGFAETNIKNLTIPHSIEILNTSFLSKSNIENVILPNTITEIGKTTFTNSTLKSIDIKEGVVMLGANAFQNTQLETVTVPSTVNIISLSVFGSCANLGECYFKVNELTTKRTNYNYLIFDKCNSTLCLYTKYTSSVAKSNYGTYWCYIGKSTKATVYYSYEFNE